MVDGWCPSCGYDLVGLTMARCPECGGRVTLRRSRLLPRVPLTKHGRYMSVEAYSAQQRASEEAEGQHQDGKSDDHSEAKQPE